MLVRRAATFYNGKALVRRNAHNFVLVAVNKRANYGNFLSGKPCHRGKAAHAPLVKKVHQKGFHSVLIVVAKGHFVAAVLLCYVVQKSAAHTGAKGAGVCLFAVFKNYIADVGAAQNVLNIPLPAEFLYGGKVVGFAAELRVKGHGDNGVILSQKTPQTRQPCKGCQRILPAGNAHGNSVAVFYHVIVNNRFAHGAHKLLKSAFAGNTYHSRSVLASAQSKLRSSPVSCISG